MSEDREREVGGAAPQKTAQARSAKTGAHKPPAKGRKHSKKRRRRRARNGAVIILAAAVGTLLILLAVLTIYGFWHRAGEPDGNTVDLGSVREVSGDGTFSDADNQEALNALSGEDLSMDDEASALLGEDIFFGEPGEDVTPERVVVAEFGDGETLMSDEVLEAYSEELTSYILSGYSEEEVAETVLDNVLHSMVSERVLEAHARELGLCELSDADRAQIEAEAAEDYDARVAACREYQIDDEGLSDEEADSAAKAWLLENEGVDLENLKAALEADWWKDKLYDALTSDVSVTDADVQAAYDEQLAEQKQRFTDYPDEYEFSQMNGELLLYHPSGYRAVKMLLLGFDDMDAEMAVFELTDDFAGLNGSETDPERQAELDSYYAGPEARAKQALEELRAGADMDEMIRKLGSDPGMMDEQQRQTGYYVCADSMMWPEAFVEAAMALKNVGDYSEPIRMDEGVCILQYIGEAPEGEVPLADVRDELRAQVLKSARDTAYVNQTQAWLDEANPKFYPERLQ